MDETLLIEQPSQTVTADALSAWSPDEWAAIVTLEHYLGHLEMVRPDELPAQPAAA